MSNRQFAWFAVVFTVCMLYGYVAGAFNPGWWYSVVVGLPVGMLSYRIIARKFL